MVGSNSSVTAPRAFSRSPLRVMSKTSVSVGSDSLRMSHHRTCTGQAAGGGCRGCSWLSRRCWGAECPGGRQLPCASPCCHGWRGAAQAGEALLGCQRLPAQPLCECLAPFPAPALYLPVSGGREALGACFGLQPDGSVHGVPVADLHGGHLHRQPPFPGVPVSWEGKRAVKICTSSLARLLCLPRVS